MIPNKQLRRIMVKYADGIWLKTDNYAETLEQAQHGLLSSEFAGLSGAIEVALILDENVSIATAYYAEYRGTDNE